ncbi:hypothetical protein BGZ61DRAFT_370112 [Ilyonectria robusta]|uniref:uncharacterized protein n=1 Tax=Ilyonectria robusta TaxID=1079257 RepID=UPI001E8D7FA5|nr:uncharacterized protein BGZ61DRAFT_370112 [Ilyonectria robusta]KAH8659672.1 hypothetical protein BGZ61DRAFT_370112 [Ilyonectria robusta]
MFHYHTKPLYQVHPPLDAVEYRDNLMGSVVKYPDMPTERYVPYKIEKLPKNIILKLNPPTQVRNIKFWTHRIKDTKVLSSVNEVLERFHEGSNATMVTKALLWHMDLPGEKFKELLKQRAYLEQVVDLLRNSKNHEGYFVTDIVTLVNYEAAVESRNSRTNSVTEQVLVNPSLGVEVGASIQHRVSSKYWYSGCYEGETIMFIGYHCVKLKKMDGAMAKLGRLFLGQNHGLKVRYGFDLWPQTIGGPAERGMEIHLDDTSGRNITVKEQRVPLPDDHAEIVRALGFDVEIVG